MQYDQVLIIKACKYSCQISPTEVQLCISELMEQTAFVNDLIIEEINIYANF